MIKRKHLSQELQGVSREKDTRSETFQKRLLKLRVDVQLSSQGDSGASYQNLKKRDCLLICRFVNPAIFELKVYMIAL